MGWIFPLRMVLFKTTRVEYLTSDRSAKSFKPVYVCRRPKALRSMNASIHKSWVMTHDLIRAPRAAIGCKDPGYNKTVNWTGEGMFNVHGWWWILQHPKGGIIEIWHLFHIYDIDIWHLIHYIFETGNICVCQTGKDLIYPWSVVNFPIAREGLVELEFIGLSGIRPSSRFS